MPGKTKTRLIPALGALGAAECYRKLAEKTVATALSFSHHHVFSHNKRVLSEHHKFLSRQSNQTFIRFYYDGGSTKEFQNWLGSKIFFKNQTDGDLGQRMCSAVSDSFELGADKVVLIGTDLPDLTSKNLEDAFNWLNNHDFVLGPSMDGGYWLVGMTKNVMKNKNIADIFDNIDWSTGRVLSQTLAATDRLNLNVYHLDLLNDLDTPDDLQAHYHKTSYITETDNSPVMTKLQKFSEVPVVSVIIPAINEAEHIGRTIDSALHPNSEIIVVDGGSSDETIEVARKKGVRVITGARGRGEQQNLGAEYARSEILLFLHADTLLPPDYAESVFMAFLDKRCIAGAFSFKTDSTRPFMKLVAMGVNLRSRWLNMPYGDQALFFRRAVFQTAGGFTASPIAEDLLLIRHLFMKKIFNKRELAILPLAVTTSARRWNSIGILRTTIINLLVLAGIMLGFQPERLSGYME